MTDTAYETPGTLFGMTQQELYDFCISNPLPGTDKWPADNPIWDCYVAGYKSPRIGWSNPAILRKAIRNLYYITGHSMEYNKYPDFVAKIKAAFEKGGVDLLRVVQARLTIAKIAPKVTALMPSMFARILDECQIDISCGIYAPMAGYGGIIRGAERWFADRGLEPKIEAYDINPKFCEYYGWIQRDALASVVKTDKIVFACPPFGPKTERWPGTPEEMYYDFHDWCKLLIEHIEAPNYIFVGPETKVYDSKKKTSGLFRKKFGIQWYPEYTKL